MARQPKHCHDCIAIQGLLPGARCGVHETSTSPRMTDGAGSEFLGERAKIPKLLIGYTRDRRPPMFDEDGRRVA